MSKSINHRKSLSPLKSAILSAVVIFLAGFGIMLVFWIFDEKDPNVYGFLHYKAATFGDGFFIPCIVGGAVYLLKSIQVRSKKTLKNIPLVMGVFFTFVGAFIQFRWLKDPDIVPNWTIPYPFYFTVAGWYHAFFFSLCLGFVVFLCVSVYLNMFSYKKSEKITLDNSIAFVVFWLGCSGYVFMHILDDYAHMFDLPCLLLLSLFLLLMVDFIWLVRPKKKIDVRIWRLSLIATGLAFFLTLIISGSNC